MLATVKMRLDRGWASLSGPGCAKRGAKMNLEVLHTWVLSFHDFALVAKKVKGVLGCSR